MKDIIRNTLLFLLGCFLSFCIVGQPLELFRSTPVKWIDNGKRNQKLHFKEYAKGLMMSDTSIIKEHTPFIDTPELAGKIAVAILEEKKDSFHLQLNYPFAINKDFYTWYVYGLCDCEGGDTTVVYFDLQSYIFINRANGMVTNIDP